MSHPEPEVRCREAWVSEMPRNAVMLATSARAHGWRVRSTYARGTSIDRRGKPAKVVESIAIRMAKEFMYVVALWVDDRFVVAFVNRPGESTTRMSARAVKALVEEDGDG